MLLPSGTFYLEVSALLSGLYKDSLSFDFDLFVLGVAVPFFKASLYLKVKTVLFLSVYCLNAVPYLPKSLLFGLFKRFYYLSLYSNYYYLSAAYYSLRNPKSINLYTLGGSSDFHN